MDQDETRFRIKLGRIGDDRLLLPRVRAAIRQRSAKTAGQHAGLKAGRQGATGGTLGPRAAKGPARRGSLPAPALAFHRRVVVRTQLAQHGAARGAPLRRQLAYLARETSVQIQPAGERAPDPSADPQAGPHADPGPAGHAVFYGAERTQIDARAITLRWARDAGHVRIMISPEDGAMMGDLTPFVREVMEGLSTRLETRLDWVAVNHWDTDNPHAHILLRAVRDTGEALVMPAGAGREVVRALAEDAATRALGPRREADVIAARWREVARLGLTGLDRGILASLDESGVSRARRPDLIARLERLEGWGLASQEAAGWRVADDLDAKLRSLARRAEVEGAIASLRRPGEHLPLLEASPSRTIEGELVRLGPGDDFFHDSLVAVIETGAGELRFARTSHADDLAALNRVRPGVLVTMGPRPVEQRPVDLAIARVSARNAGLYNEALHATAEPHASPDLRAAAVRRLEAMDRAGLIARTREGLFVVGFDHAARAIAFDEMRAARLPLAVSVASYLTLEEQVGAGGPTRLDRTLMGEEAAPGGQGPFARRYANALLQRRAFLIAEGVMRSDETAPRPGRLAQMAHDERRALAASLGRERGRSVTSAPLASVRGVFREVHDLAQGRMALIDAGRSAHLVPWSAQLDAFEGRRVEGVLRREGYQWTWARQRSLELEL